MRRTHNTFSTSFLASKYTDLVQIGTYEANQFTGQRTFNVEEENVPVIIMAIDASEIIQNLNSIPIADYKFITDKKLSKDKVIYDGYNYYQVVASTYIAAAGTYTVYTKEVTI